MKQIKISNSNVKTVFIVFIALQLVNSLVESKHLFRNYKQADHSGSTQRVLLISLDGFRHDYIEAYNLENFSKFVQEGTKASYNNPQFPAQSFPNHWSIVTGAYVEVHGIIANNFYDPLYKEFFNKNKKDLKWWNETEPIWSQAAQQGVKTGILHWPGSDILFTNSSLYSTMISHDNLSLNAKVIQAIKLFQEQDYKFISIYHNQPDSISHKYGINSPEFNVTLFQLDESIGYLIAQLKLNHLFDNNFNVIIVSDHGMANIKRNIIINEYIQADVDAAIWSYSKNLIHLKPLIDLDILVAKLNKIPSGLVRLVLKENIPENLNFKSNRRIADVILMAVEGVGFIYVTKDPFQMNHNGQMTSLINLTYEQKKQLMIASADRANHGFDKIYPSMRGIFLASGTRFKKNYTSDQHIENIDVYPLLCEILAVECETRNGSISRVKRFLKNENLFRVNRIFNQKQVMTYHDDEYYSVSFRTLPQFQSICFGIIFYSYFYMLLL